MAVEQETTIIDLTKALAESLAAGDAWDPKEVGLYEDVEEERYHKGPGLSQSLLKILRTQTPAHLKAALDARQDPDDEEEETKSQGFGSAIHDRVLRPEIFKRDWRISPEGVEDRRLKSWKEFEKEHPRKKLLKFSEGARVNAIGENVYSKPVIRRILESPTARTEVSAVWTDPLTGVLMRGRVDLDDEGLGIHLDLKSTDRGIGPSSFRWRIRDQGMHIQGACYRSGWATLGHPRRASLILAVEMSPPNGCILYRLDDQAMRRGAEEYRQLLGEYVHCRDNDSWPDWGSDILPIGLPM